ncbi:MAG: hypothetical protein QXU73_02975 [Thermoplasmata archaeon]
MLVSALMLVSSLSVLGSEPASDVKGESLPTWSKIMHLHDGTRQAGGIYDWMNASGPANPPWTDYDGDGIPGITIKKNVPPQRYHAWIMYPPVSMNMFFSGSLSAHIWAYSFGNESGTIVSATFYDITASQFSDPTKGVVIARASSPLQGPYYSQVQMVNLVNNSVSYSLPQDHYLALTIERGDSINDWLIVWFDRTDYDSYVLMTTSQFISADSAWVEDSKGAIKAVFTDLDDLVVALNVSDPFGAYEIAGAAVSVSYASNGTEVVSSLSMTPVDWDKSPIPYWKFFKGTVPSLESGKYVVNASASDLSGSPTWLEISLTVITVDHFEVSAPAVITAGVPFEMTVAAKDSENNVMANWTGNVTLTAYRTDCVTPANGTLSVLSVEMRESDLGQLTIHAQSYSRAEEQIYIRASAGSKDGWSGLVTVRAGPVASISINYSGDPIVPAGASKVFRAIGLDAQGNENLSWSPYWSLSGGIGSLSAEGFDVILSATSVGSGVLDCRDNLTGTSANLTVTVVVGALVRIDITSPSYPLAIREGEQVVLTATGYDAFGNVVDIDGATWDTNTSGTLFGSGTTCTYKAGFVPETGSINVRLGTVVGTLSVVVLTASDGPWLSPIPDQIKSEDYGTWQLSLNNYWHDVNGTSTLFWWVEDVNTSLYFISHDPSSNAIMRFSTQPDQWGIDRFILWVIDPTGYRTFQWITVRINPVNDPPQFVNNVPTELYVKFDEPYSFDYSYFVKDVDNSKSELTLSSDVPPAEQNSLYNVTFVWLEATFIFNRLKGDESYFKIVTLTVRDPSGDYDQERIVVWATDDSPPEMRKHLPDVFIDEGEIMVYKFDLDDYFFDPDGEALYYTAGFENIPEPYIEPGTNMVYFSAPGEWSGVTEGTFIGKDSLGAMKVDTITVTVNATNDAPIVTPIQEVIQVRYGVPYYIYLSQYVYDPDNSMDSLTFEINESHVVKGISPMGAHRLELNFPPNLTEPAYTEPYRVCVGIVIRDPELAAAYMNLTILVTDNRPPTLLTDNPDVIYITFEEDTILSDALLLYELFSDEDDAMLSFTVEAGDTNLFFSVLPGGRVNLWASVNWSGISWLNITATDSKGGWAAIRILVIVSPVNDAPVLMPLPDIRISGSRSVKLDISGFVYDSDSAYITITASPETYAVVVGNYLYVTLPKGTKSVTITLTASDGQKESASQALNVVYVASMAEKIGYPYTLPLVLLAAGVAGYFVGTRLPRPFALENLFLIHNDGRLVAHVTKEDNTNLDKDVVSAMFTAVQEFVRDSFQKGEVGLKKLEIGDKNVLIEKGKSAYLALIYSGWPPKDLLNMLPMLERDIEERYKDRLERWNGTAKSVRGVEKMLQDYMTGTYKPGAWHEEEEIAEEEWVDILSKEA